MESAANLDAEMDGREKALLAQLRSQQRAQRSTLVPFQRSSRLSLGQRIANAVVATLGSWGFIVGQTTILAVWVGFNALSARGWDPFPFILLNLGLSFQAAYAAPFIMMSQNRQQELDRQEVARDFRINIKAELEIELLHQKIDALREKEILMLTSAVEKLAERLNAETDSRAEPAAEPDAATPDTTRSGPRPRP